MKKLFSLLMALCLVLCGSAALAAPQTADAAPLALDGFTLNLEAGAVYDLAEKTEGAVYVTVYPEAARADTATNYNIIWVGDDVEITLDLVRMETALYEEQVKEGFAEQGLEASDMVLSEVEETTLAGETAAFFSTSMKLSVSGMTVDVFQRQYYVYSKHMIITISAQTQETLEKVVASLDGVLVW